MTDVDLISLDEADYLSDDDEQSIRGMLPDDPQEWPHPVDMDAVYQAYDRGWDSYPSGEKNLSQNQCLSRSQSPNRNRSQSQSR